MNRNLADGEQLLFQGDLFTLKVVEYSGKLTKVGLSGNNIVIRLHKDKTHEERNREIRIKLEQWYRTMARESILERINWFQKILQVKCNDVRIKEQKTRWGSCSLKGNLNFNWRIVMAPSDIIDYIVVHELCHLIHMNHSRDYWQLVEKYIPDYRDRRNWLTKKGMGLRI